MKKIFIAGIAILGLAFTAEAQKKSGAIQFESTMDPAVMAKASGITIPDEMLARMPKATKTSFELLFTPTAASYMPVQETEDSNGGGGGGGMGRMMMRFGGGGGNREYFYTAGDSKIAEVFDLNDTTYVMSSKLTLANPAQMGSMNFGGGNRDNANKDAAKDGGSGVVYSKEPPVLTFVKSDETKTIVGFLCKKVTVTSTRKATVLGMEKNVTEDTILWYTNDLGFNFSPNTNMWTEGAVLAIEGRGTGTVAKSIEYRGVSSKDVVAPKKAVAITAEEYAVKMENMMKRLRGGNGQQRQNGQTRSITIN